MGAGLTVYNNDNKIQIDGMFKNLQLSRKILLSGTGDTSGTFADGEVLAAVGGTTSQSIDAYCSNTTTGWKCTVKTFTSGMAVYVFTTKATASTHGVGLEVYNEDGVIVYNSNEKHPVVMGFGNNDSTAAGTATKPAIAVCQHRRTLYNRQELSKWYTSAYETKYINHPAEYGYITKTGERYVYHDAVYEWQAGHYENQYVAGHYENQYVAGYYDWQFVNGSYQQVYVPGGYQNVWVPGGYQQVWVEGKYALVTPAHSEWETYTYQEYGIVKQAWTETVTELVWYEETYEVIVTLYTDTNFKLTTGNITSGTASEGEAARTSHRLVSKKTIPQYYGQVGQAEQWWGEWFQYTSVVVDTRSWILFDVNGL